MHDLIQLPRRGPQRAPAMAGMLALHARPVMLLLDPVPLAQAGHPVAALLLEQRVRHDRARLPVQRHQGEGVALPALYLHHPRYQNRQ